MASTSQVPEAEEHYELLYCEKHAVGEKKSYFIPKFVYMDWYNSYVIEKSENNTRRQHSLLGCTGDKGTRIYQHLRSTGIQELERWELKKEFKGLQGKICLWSPKDKWLAVATEQDGNDFLCLVKEAKNQGFKSKVIHEVKDRRKITSIAWSPDGAFLLVCETGIGNLVVLKWHKDRDYNRKRDWQRVFLDLSSPECQPPYTAVFCSNDLILACGPNSNIVGGEEITDQVYNKWRKCLESNDEETYTGLTFDDGTWVAAIRTRDSAVCLWQLANMPKRSLIKRHEIPAIDVNIPPNVNWYYGKLITFTSSIGSMSMYKHGGGGWKECSLQNTMGGDLFNKIIFLAVNSKFPMFACSVTTGFIIIGTIHRKKTPIQVYREARDFMAELKYYGDELSEWTLADKVESLERTIERTYLEASSKLTTLHGKSKSSDARCKKIAMLAEAILCKFYETFGETVPKAEVLEFAEEVLLLSKEEES